MSLTTRAAASVHDSLQLDMWLHTCIYTTLHCHSAVHAREISCVQHVFDFLDLHRFPDFAEKNRHTGIVIRTNTFYCHLMHHAFLHAAIKVKVLAQHLNSTTNHNMQRHFASQTIGRRLSLVHTYFDLAGQTATRSPDLL